MHSKPLHKKRKLTPDRLVRTALKLSPIIIVAIILVIILSINLTSYPKDLASLRTATTDRIALNCKLSHPNNSDYHIIQTDQNWQHIRTTNYYGRHTTNTIIIPDSAIYTWTDTVAIKNSYSPTYLDEVLNLTNTKDPDLKINCSDPTDNDFTIPDKNW